MRPVGPAPIDRGWIATHLPHQGRMCLLETVEAWDAHSILCRACSHRAGDHPLRSHGRLGAGSLIEYAAQAVAVHGALLQGPHALPRVPAIGVLASARSLELSIDDLTRIEEDLAIHARRQHADPRGALYEFEIRAGARTLARGRVSVVLEAALTLRGSSA